MSTPSLPRPGAVTLIDVFTRDARGGNPVPLVLDARTMSTADMQAVAAQYGHESAFILPAENPQAEWRLRFFVPAHEMEMCGHASVGSMWALRQWGLWQSESAVVETLSGLVYVEWDETLQCPWISQPETRSAELDSAQTKEVLTVLFGDSAPACGGRELRAINAATSRVKTLVELPDASSVHALNPDFSRMKHLCEHIDSTGLYPYAIEHPIETDASLRVHARQFPKSSGYPEDAATGIAAAALWGYLHSQGQFDKTGGVHAQCVVLQGEAMGSPSAIYVRERIDATGENNGCWVSGQVCWRQVNDHQ